MREKETLIPKHGGYRKLKSFQVAQLVYDVTVRFCDRYVEKRSRTRDQMVQAARSGVQNIAEGSQASGTSKKTELKLTNVARASLEELRLDYEDFLRQRGFTLWDRNDARRGNLIARRCTSANCVAMWVKQQHGLGGNNGPGGQNGHHGQNGLSGQRHSPKQSSSVFTESMVSTKSTGSMRAVATDYSETAANACLVLITVACSLLDRQLASLATAFEREGGFTERLYRVRRNARESGR
jgi:four helix bundle suffix protein